MNIIPIVAETERTPEPQNIESAPAKYSENVIPIDYAQRLIDEAANRASLKFASEVVPKVAEEAASKAISSYALSNKSSVESSGGISILDRKGITLTQQEYERVRKDAGGMGDGPGNMMSLGKRFEDALNQKFTDEVMGNLIGNMFRSGSPGAAGVKKSHSGIMGYFFEIADTKMGYALGQKIGENVTDLVKTLGQERVGALIDAYSGKTPPGQQAGEPQLSPEEQQKRAEAKVMSFDSTNINDMAEFMQATGIKNLQDAQKILLAEQNKILQNRGLTIPQQQETERGSIESRETTDRRQRAAPKNDMNRELMDRYDNPKSPNNQPYQSTGSQTSPPSNDFFSNTPSGLPSPGIELQQTPEEIILSLNPDEPSSLHQYMALRGITGVDQSIVKKMLMKEQRALLDKEKLPDSSTGSSLSSVSPPETEVSNQKEQEQQQPSTSQVKEKEEEKPEKSPEPSKKEKESSYPMDTIMRVLDKLDKKIDQMEEEIKELKASNQIKDNSSITIPGKKEPEKPVLGTEIVVSKSPKIVSFNDVTSDTAKDINLTDGYVEVDNIKVSVSNDNKISQNDIKEEKIKEVKTNTPKSEKEEIDWWGERRQLLNNTDKDIENVLSNTEKEKEHKRFTIKKKEIKE